MSSAKSKYLDENANFCRPTVARVATIETINLPGWWRRFGMDKAVLMKDVDVLLFASDIDVRRR